MQLVQLAETATTITLGWTPVTGCTGYRFTAEKQVKPSHTWDPDRNQVKFSKGSAWYRVEALGVEDADTWPDPPPTGKPLTNNITSNGTYTGTISGVVNVASGLSVTITDYVLNAGRFQLGGAVDLTIQRGRVNGVDAWNSDRWLVAGSGYRRLVVSNNTIVNTRGIYIGPNHYSTTPPTVLITRNRHTNIKGTTQGGSLGDVGNFVQFAAPWGGPMDGGTNPNPGILECSWNEIINEHNKSNPEDVFSLYKASHTRIHDNLVNGQTKPDSMTGSSQNTITVDPHQEAFLCFDNIIERNFVIDAYAIGMFGGNNNVFRDNHVVSDGMVGDTGQPMRYGYEGMWVASGFSGNLARGNQVGYIGSQGRVDGRLDGAGDWTNNTQLPNPITRQTELAHIQMWRDRVAAAGITIGA